MEPAIRLEKLTKYYGSHRGVVDVDLEVMPGEIFGYLGPNGAGKSTTIRILLDLIRPTSGSLSVMGLDAQADAIEVRRRVGYVPSDPGMYGGMTGREYLTYAAGLRGGVDWREVERLAERLSCDLSRRIDTLSHGNRQKVVVIQAFMHRPDVLVLDEPTTGLDPLVQEEFKSLLLETRDEGRTVFLSSHVLPEVEEICDRVAIIREGRIVVVEDVASLKARRVRSIEIEFGGQVAPDDFDGLAGVRNISVSDRSLRCDIEGSLAPLFRAAGRYEIVNVTTREPGLEEAFLAYYGLGEERDA